VPLLYLVRHGQTDWNAEGRMQGHSDRPLNTLGRIQAAAIGSRLSTAPLTSIYTSDLQRARHTADAIARYHNLPVQVDERLREVGFGAWEGAHMEELAERHPIELAGWRMDPPHYLPEGAETPQQVNRRVARFISDLRALPQDERILIVAHGLTLRTLMGLVAPWPYQRRREVVENASLSTIQLYPDHAVVMSLNDRAHLVEVDQILAVAQ
jgi:broad specificity phosphatase PhoE